MTSTTLVWRSLHLAPLLLAALCWASPALAQTAEEQRAERLFREGREAVDRSDFATGCAKFAESLRLTQRPGPLLNLANCEEHQGRFVAALAHWTDGIALLPANDERVTTARQRVEALSRRIPRLTVVLASSAPQGAKITLDGAAISPAALGVPQPTDLGEHVVVAAAPGHADARSTLILGEGERREITVTPGMPIVVALPTPATPPIVATPPSAGGNGARTAGFVVGGVGVASLAVGVITGVMTVGKNNELDDLCTPLCAGARRDEVTSLQSSGKTLSTVSTIMFVAGAVGVGAGVTLVLLGGPRRAPTTATLTPLVTTSGGGLAMRGSF